MDEKMDTPQELKGLDSDEGLEHYGVIGMKWGIRRYQPYPSGKSGKFVGDKAKKAVSSGAKKAGNVLSKTGNAAASTAKKAAKTVSTKLQEHKTAKAKSKQREENKDRFDKAKAAAELRKKTLASNDPSEIVKGLHTLSDQEVQDKMKRLMNENKIKEMAPKQKESAKDVVKGIVKDAAKEKIVKPIVNKAASEVEATISNQIFNSVSKTTGVPKETVEAAAKAVEKTVTKTAVAKVPVSEIKLVTSNSSEAYNRFSRYSGNYGSDGGKSSSAYDRYSRSSKIAVESYANRSPEHKTSGQWAPTYKQKQSYAQRNWTYHSAIEEK